MKRTKDIRNIGREERNRKERGKEGNQDEEEKIKL